MSGQPHYYNLLSKIKDLDEGELSRLFSLSCFDRGHWEDAPAWEINEAEVEDQIRAFSKELLGDSVWRSIDRNGDPEAFIGSFSGGRMSNEILAIYLEREFRDYYCETESKTSESQFDITLCRDGVAACDIEIKRMATTNQIVDYIYSFRNKCQSISNANKQAMLNFFPTTTASSSSRAGDFLIGYRHLATCSDPFFETENCMIVCLPAPISDSDEYNTLYETKNIIRDGLDIGR